MFDSHCHLHDARIVDQCDVLVARAKEKGLTGALLAGVDPDGWDVEDRLRARHPELEVSYGVHPQGIAALSPEEARRMVDALAARLERAPRPAAIGEIGLDGLDDNRASFDLQEELFRRQLALAVDYALPVSLHILRAHERALAVLDSAALPKQGGVVHSYSGSAELVRRYLAHGLSISFAGSVTWLRAKKVHAAVLAVPRDRLLVETDAPDQTPAAHRPGLSEPAFLIEIIDAVAQIRGESASEVAAYTADNARRLFAP